MQKIDMANTGAIALGISATLSGTTPAKGNIVDVDPYLGATFMYATGVVTDAGAAGGFSVEIQESDDTADTNFAAVAADDLTRAESDLDVILDTFDSEAVGMIGYKGGKKYIRAVITGTTATNAIVLGVWSLQKPQNQPPASDIVASVAAT